MMCPLTGAVTDKTRLGTCGNAAVPLPSAVRLLLTGASIFRSQGWAFAASVEA